MCGSRLGQMAFRCSCSREKADAGKRLSCPLSQTRWESDIGGSSRERKRQRENTKKKKNKKKKFGSVKMFWA